MLKRYIGYFNKEKNGNSYESEDYVIAENQSEASEYFRKDCGLMPNGWNVRLIRVVEDYSKPVTEDEKSNYNYKKKWEADRQEKEAAEREAENKRKVERDSQFNKEKAEQLSKHRESIAKYRGCISSGFFHTVGLKTNGTVVAVGGINASGEKNVTDWRHIIAIAVGDAFTLGLKADGTVVAVGGNQYGPCNISEWRDIIAIAAGSSHSIGLKADGTVVAVGENSGGCCNVSGWRDIIAVSAKGYRSFGIKSDGTVVSTCSYSNGLISHWRNIVAIEAGSLYLFGLKSDGTIVSDGNVVEVAKLRDIVAISCSASLLFLKSDGSVVEFRRGESSSWYCSNKNLWSNIVGIVAGSKTNFGLTANGNVVYTDFESYGLFDKPHDVSGWYNIGPMNKEEHCLNLQINKEKQRQIQQSNEWQSQGLCKYCGGECRGFFVRKCTKCGKKK